MRNISIFDFDGTIFLSPEPSKRLWTSSTRSFLQSSKNFIHGGWWGDPRVLMATGRGIELEEPDAWDGWWNEDVLKVVRGIMSDPNSHCILFSGRKVEKFSEPIGRLMASKGLKFDVVALRTPNFKDTLSFKCAYIPEIIKNNPDLEEIAIYDDRPHLVAIYKNLFPEVLQKLGLQDTVKATAICVARTNPALDPVIEEAVAREMIKAHNEMLAQIPENPTNQFKLLRMENEYKCTGYILMPESRALLLDTFRGKCLESFMYFQKRFRPRDGLNVTIEAKTASLQKRINYVATCAVVFSHGASLNHQALQIKMEKYLGYYGDRVFLKVIGMGGWKESFFIKVVQIPASHWESIEKRRLDGESDLGPPVPSSLLSSNPPIFPTLYIPFATLAKKRAVTITPPQDDPDDPFGAPLDGYNWVDFGESYSPTGDGKPMLLDGVFGDLSQKKLVMDAIER